LVEEFHIKNIVGALERKQWVFGGRVTLNGAGRADVDLLTLSSAIIPKLDHYFIEAQKINAAPIEETFADLKTNVDFRLNGDANQETSVIILGAEPIPPKSQRKWAKDYCPFCKSQNFIAVAGSTLSDQVLFSFTHTQVAGTDTVLFKDEMTIRKISGDAGGQLTGSLVSQMADNAYQIVITKSTYAGGAIAVLPYPTNLTKIGFDLVGTAGQTYDVLVLGQIMY
jgi:hypothetical protein